MMTIDIDKFTDIRTPFYFYDLDLLHSTLKTMKAVAGDDYVIHYAIKANANPTLLKIISAYGLGADCVSGGEIKVAIENGFNADKIVFAGMIQRGINLSAVKITALGQIFICRLNVLTALDSSLIFRILQFARTGRKVGGVNLRSVETFGNKT